jgi:hypothetical protein
MNNEPQVKNIKYGLIAPDYIVKEFIGDIN